MKNRWWVYWGVPCFRVGMRICRRVELRRTGVEKGNSTFNIRGAGFKSLLSQVIATASSLWASAPGLETVFGPRGQADQCSPKVWSEEFGFKDVHSLLSVGLFYQVAVKLKLFDLSPAQETCLPVTMNKEWNPKGKLWPQSRAGVSLCPLWWPSSFICPAGPEPSATVAAVGRPIYWGWWHSVTFAFEWKDDDAVASHGMPKFPQLSRQLSFLDPLNLISDVTVFHWKSQTTNHRGHSVHMIA